MLPRALGDGTVSAEGRETLRVVSANVFFGKADAQALVELVDRYEADLLSVQELTPRFTRELREAGLARLLPNAIVETQPRAGGAGLYSRLPLRKISGGHRFSFRQPRAVLQMPDGRRVRVVGVHPFPPGRGNDEVWREALESLPSAGEGAPWILLGDFNSTLDISEFRDVLDRGYRDAAAVAGEGLEPTWPNADHSTPPVITIDHVLADARLGIVDFEVEDLPGSDHRPLQAELALPEASTSGR